MAVGVYRCTKHKAQKKAKENSISTCSRSDRTVFSLIKIAFYSCDEFDQLFYDNRLNGINIDIQICCVTLFKLMKMNSQYHESERVRRNRYQNNFNLCTFAALYGHIDCLKIAHEGGCPWEAMTCSVAAQQGFVECLAYALENGCAWRLTDLARSYKTVSKGGEEFAKCKEYIERLL